MTSRIRCSHLHALVSAMPAFSCERSWGYLEPHRDISITLTELAGLAPQPDFHTEMLVRPRNVVIGADNHVQGRPYWPSRIDPSIGALFALGARKTGAECRIYRSAVLGFFEVELISSPCCAAPPFTPISSTRAILRFTIFTPRAAVSTFAFLASRNMRRSSSWI
jgi:hypothetical protein